MNGEQIAVAVLRVVDVRPGDLLVACPPPGDVLWSMEQAEGLRRHLAGKLAGKDVDVVVLRAPAQLAALRKAEAEALWEAEASQLDRGVMTADEWRQRREGNADAAA